MTDYLPAIRANYLLELTRTAMARAQRLCPSARPHQNGAGLGHRLGDWVVFHTASALSQNGYGHWSEAVCAFFFPF